MFSYSGNRFHVDIELTGTHTAGTTVVDLWNYKNIPLLPNETIGEGKEGWSGEGRNVWLVEELEVSSFVSTLSFLYFFNLSTGLTPFNLIEGRWFLEGFLRSNRACRAESSCLDDLTYRWPRSCAKY